MNSPDRQMIQTATCLPSVGKICSETHQSGKGHYDASLSRRGFGGSVHLSAISDDSQDWWSAALFGSGSVWFSQIEGCWGNTFICLSVMGPPMFLYCSVSHTPILPKGCCSGRQEMTNPSCGGGLSLRALLRASATWAMAHWRKEFPSCYNLMSPSEEGLN